MPLPLAAVPLAVFGALFLAAGEEEERESGFNGDPSSGSGRPEVDALEKISSFFRRLGRTIVPWPDGQVVKREGYDRARIRFTGSPELTSQEKSYVSYYETKDGLRRSIRVQQAPFGSGEPDTVELALTK